ncbi:rhomboid family intramembrane serine protease [Natronoflexus pectinivorans]|uniref:Membrane associated rhomboid family serine protease n=1 Tax=Natronoflexus pectinivorans TaxID=682526 RepID=A0A4R2GND5_9BACT|nr:rhomboid family intramembrane serine protease [Natronoflexus pectinivorans]TCO10795.1 membrane associated rhomboid family serine protease [Natronoflexus pectinivorans]
MNFGASPFGSLTPVVKNLLIINGIFFLASIMLAQNLGIRFEKILGLHVPMADNFQPYQLVTYMFLHAYPQFYHVFFNMFALFMFGRMLEMVWGPKRFLIFYFVTGIGAALIHLTVQYIEIVPVLKEITNAMNNPTHENLSQFFVLQPNQEISREVAIDSLMRFRTDFLNSHITIGASGAVFGILLAFGMLFPDTRLMLLFPPIPIKAKYFVIFYGVLELFLGISRFTSVNMGHLNVAHFAHLGGMLWGFILIKYWQKKGIY